MKSSRARRQCGPHPRGGPRPRRGPRPVWGPGIAAAALATVVAYTVAHRVPGLNPSIVAVVLGALVTNLGLHRPVLHAGTRLAGKRLLRWAVVLLGLQLSLPELVRLGARGLAVVVLTVTVTFVGTQVLARLLGVSPARGLLVATGFSICGASAVAAMEPVAGGDEEDTSVAVALVTLCGTLAILVLPALRGPLGLDVAEFGSWAGGCVHDVGQTVATAQRVPGALTTAVVVKLTRVVLLAPLVASIGLLVRHRHRQRVPAAASVPVPAGGPESAPPEPARGAAEGDAGRPVPPPVPLFVAGFLVAIALTSTGLLPERVLADAESVQSALLVAALFGLGTGIHVPSLLRTGGRCLVLGLVSWVLVAVAAYAGVRVAAG